MTNVRKPPIEAVYALHLPRERGKCPWCGLPQEERTPVRKLLKFMHAACQTEVDIITQPERARSHVFDRDHGICRDCGEDWSHRYLLRKGVEVGIWEGAKSHAERALGFWRYTEVIYVSLWHVDHGIPLWKATHMPPVQRIEYFKLANLVTRCDPCHARKTKKEAAERARFRHNTGDEPKKRKTAWPKGRKLQSRGFPDQKRPMRKR